MSPRHVKPWSKAEVALLTQLSVSIPTSRWGRNAEITAALQGAGYMRTVGAVRKWLSDHRKEDGHRPDPWTEAETNQLIAAVVAVRARGGTLSDVVTEMSIAGYARSYHAVRQRMRDNHLSLSCPVHQPTPPLPPVIDARQDLADRIAMTHGQSPSHQESIERQIHRALIARCLQRVFPTIGGTA